MSESKSALDKEWIKFLSRLFSIVGIPVCTWLLATANMKFDAILANENKLIKQNEIHDNKINDNTKRIDDINKVNLYGIARQNATINSLKANSIIGTEFWVDYDNNETKELNKIRFTNPTLNSP